MGRQAPPGVLDVDRWRHVGDTAQHHRRAPARVAEITVMDLLPTSEQTEIIDSSADYVSSRLSIERMRRLFEAGTTPALDDAAWAGATELGWFVLGLPEQYGGI